MTIVPELQKFQCLLLATKTDNIKCIRTTVKLKNLLELPVLIILKLIAND